MRLINTEDLSMHEFDEGDVPPYAILSHTWENDEVLFSDLPLNSSQAIRKEGYTKIKYFCANARARQFKYAWVDTCCIDKSSTAELTEAINSMYQWYEQAGLCFVYLYDITDLEFLEYNQGHIPLQDLLKNCRWFTRGWTLQELIAPLELEFYDSRWNALGSKLGLAQKLSNITRIPREVLEGESPLSCSIAQRMSWAANRQTKRKEDRAYSLLGLFDVSLPMIYGTRHAFMRLQEEIIKYSDDQSIFAWTSSSIAADSSSTYSGLLATSPDDFANCQDIIRADNKRQDLGSHKLSNRGLSINMFVSPCREWTYIAMLNCAHKSMRKSVNHFFRYSILLRKVEENGHYARVDRKEPALVDPKIFVTSEPLKIYVRQNPGQEYLLRYGIELDTSQLTDISPKEFQWITNCPKTDLEVNKRDSIYIPMPADQCGTVAVMYRYAMAGPKVASNYRFGHPSEVFRYVKLGFNKNFLPICLIGVAGNMWGYGPIALAPSQAAFQRAQTLDRNPDQRNELLGDDWIITARDSSSRLIRSDGKSFEHKAIENTTGEFFVQVMRDLGIRVSMFRNSVQTNMKKSKPSYTSFQDNRGASEAGTWVVKIEKL